MSKTAVNIYSTDEIGLNADDGGKWVLVCETHGHIIQDTNKRRLLGWKRYPNEWCEACMEEEN